MTYREIKEKEIETIKARNITIELSDADVQRLWEKAASVGLSASELLKNFIGDLVNGTYSNGSDERMYADEWLERCWFSHAAEHTFLRYLVCYGDVEMTVRRWESYCSSKEELQKEEAADDEDRDQEWIDSIKDDIECYLDELTSLFNEYHGPENETLESEMPKVQQWLYEMKKMQSLA